MSGGRGKGGRNNNKGRGRGGRNSSSTTNQWMILWTKRFLEAQGYKGVRHVIDQDNQSTLKLAKNRRTSAGKRTRHMNMRYFYISQSPKTG